MTEKEGEKQKDQLKAERKKRQQERQGEIERQREGKETERKAGERTAERDRGGERMTETETQKERDRDIEEKRAPGRAGSLFSLLQQFQAQPQERSELCPHTLASITAEKKVPKSSAGWRGGGGEERDREDRLRPLPPHAPTQPS